MNPISRLFRRSSTPGPQAGTASDWIERMPWINLVLAGIVAALSIASLSAITLPEKDAAMLQTWTIVALFALVASMIVWFIRAFTFSLAAADNALQTVYRRQIFIFAYAFTFISFVVVTMPARDLFKVDETHRTISPISMFYGCFDYGPNFADTPIPRCEIETVPSDDPARQGERKRDYALLLALGGAAAKPIDRIGTGDANAGYDESAVQKVYRVSGGLVMPLYVVLVAMIGGAISLSRRIPEIQKRADPTFPGTPQQTPLQLFEAREQVVFQIMQLISAPFIAICSFQILEPRGTASAVALAFGSGFASESILLMIRGVVDGIRPGVPHTVASELAQLSGMVCDAQGTPVADAVVRLPSDVKRPGLLNEVRSGPDGNFLFSGVPKRRYVITAAKGSLAGQEIVEVTSDAEHVVITLKEAPAAEEAAAPAALGEAR